MDHQADRSVYLKLDQLQSKLKSLEPFRNELESKNVAIDKLRKDLVQLAEDRDRVISEVCIGQAAC